MNRLTLIREITSAASICQIYARASRFNALQPEGRGLCTGRRSTGQKEKNYMEK
jgi:hypothetical protein